MVERGRRATDSLIPEVMNVLNEWLDPPPDIAFAHAVDDAGQFIARQRLLEHCNKGAVARKEHGSGLSEVLPSGRYVQPDECFSRTWHANKEDDRLLTLASSSLDDFLHCARSDREVFRTRIIA